MLRLCLVVSAVVLLNLGMSMDTPRLQRIPLIAAGSFLCLLLCSILYVRTTNPKPVLKILDWSLVIFAVLMMPCFDLLNVPPFYWFLLVLLPCIGARLFITWYVRVRV